MLKIAIVGCGKIADAHITQIQRIPGCEVIAACDREELMAQQLGERFGIKQLFTDLGRLLPEARPDVVHVTTPPGSHYDITRCCLEHGSHVYVEKPFTLHAFETEKLLKLAEEKRLKLTVGHDAQFSHAATEFRKIVKSGYLGGPAVHMESYYGYEFGGVYGNALLTDKNHWVRKLPGQLLQNVISHGIARVAEFLAGDNPEVIAHGFASPVLQSVGEEEIVDEARVIIRDEKHATAYFTFSSQMRPVQHNFRVFGPKNGLVLDEDQQIVLKIKGQRYKSYAEKFIPPVTLAKQHLGNLSRNAKLFLKNNFHIDSGKRNLFELFYRSIRGNTPVPIAYREILMTARIMESIFEQVRVKPVNGSEESPRQEFVSLQRV